MSKFGAIATSIMMLASIGSAANAEVTEVSAVLESAQKGGGSGYLSGEFDDQTNILKYKVRYEGLSGPVIAAHYHGPAEPGGKAGVAVPLAKPLDSPIKAEATLTDEQARELLNGLYYLNLHTEKNPGGEIRGQVKPTEIIELGADLKSETDGVDGAGSVKAWFDETAGLLVYHVDYEGLTGPVTAAHFHGPAEPGGKAGVAVPLSKPLDSPIEARVSLTKQQISDLLAGKYYLNLHTEKYPGGEIRGQVLVKG